MPRPESPAAAGRSPEDFAAVLANDISGVGGHGIKLTGGDDKTLTPAGKHGIGPGRKSAPWVVTAQVLGFRKRRDGETVTGGDRERDGG